MSWESAAFLAAVALLALYHVGALGWLWRRFVVRSATSIWKRPASTAERPAVPNSVRFSIFQRDKFKCVYCGRRVRDGAELDAKRLDHFVPWRIVKKHEAKNFVTACRQCNSGKGGRVMKEPIEDFVR